MRRFAGIVLSMLLLIVLSACEEEASITVAPTATPASTPVAAVFTLPRTKATLHPILGSDRTNLTLSPLVWEGLFELDNTFTPQNVLCQSYSASEDGLSWTFTLRSDVTFSDGAPLTAEDAAQSLRLAMSPASRFASRLSGIQSVAAGDAHTLTVILSYPNGSLPALLDIPVVRGESDEPLGTGPYRIEGYGDDSRLVLRTDWWQKKTLPLTSIPLLLVDGADNLIYAFDTFDISLVTTDLTGTNALGYSTGYEAWDCPTTDMLYVGFNTAKGACTDPLVRQALSRCFDRTTVANSLFLRHAQAAALPVSPASSLYDSSLAEECSYSTQEAAALFSQAGYTLEDGTLTKSRKALSLTFLVNSENSFKTSAADYLALELEKLGVSVEVQKLSWADYEKALTAGAFDLYLGETMLTADFDLSALIAKTGPLNFGKYNDAETAALLSAFRSAAGQARSQAAAALYRRLKTEAPFTTLCYKNTSVLTQWGMVSGVNPSQANAFFDLQHWSVDAG